MCGQDKYKNRGNNVYSLCIPVPSYREKTPKICIEHLYLDEDIRRKVIFPDGVERRIFMGNEFSKTGVLIDGRDFHCTDINCCGSQSIGIIDGSGKRKVYKNEDVDEKNCALTKMDFATYVLEKKSHLLRWIFPVLYRYLKLYRIFWLNRMWKNNP